MMWFSRVIRNIAQEKRKNDYAIADMMDRADIRMVETVFVRRRKEGEMKNSTALEERST